MLRLGELEEVLTKFWHFKDKFVFVMGKYKELLTFKSFIKTEVKRKKKGVFSSRGFVKIFYDFREVSEIVFHHFYS